MKDENRVGRLWIEALLGYANSIIGTLREPFLVLDKDLRVISANEAFYTTFEVSEKDTISCQLFDLGNGQWNIPPLIKLLKEIIPEKNIVRDYEVAHEFEKLGRRVMIVNARQLRVSRRIAATIAASARQEEGEEGEEESLILIAIADITERKSLEEGLKESEERFRRAFETSEDGLLLIHKTEGDILNSNASVQKLLEYSPEELLTKKLWDIGVTRDRNNFQETVSRLERSSVINYEDLLITTKNGLTVDTEVFLVDKAKVMQCNIRDITERKRTEKALSQAQERARQYYEIAAIIMLVVDGDEKVGLINEKGCEVLGRKKEEIEGKNWFDNFIPARIREEVRSVFHRILNGEDGLFGYYESSIIKGDEERLIAWNNTVLKDSTGKIISVLSSGEDITERKKKEAEAEKRLRELEIFYRASIGREERILELKKEIETLKMGK